MRTLVQALHLGGSYDHLNLPCLAAFETLSRRIAQIIEAYSADAKVPRWGNVHLYQGTSDPIAAIDPGLRTAVARKRKEELEVSSLANKVLAPRFGEAGSEGLPAPGPPRATDGPKAKYKPKKGLQPPEGGAKK